jgi:cytochrome c
MRSPRGHRNDLPGEADVSDIQAVRPRPGPLAAFALAVAAALVVVAIAIRPATGQGAAPAGDPVAGAVVFELCSACHNIGPDATNAVGPILNGIIGRKAGTVADFEYSEANKRSGLVWDERTLAAYLPDPEKMIPGTAMAIGVTEPKEVADVIAYLKLFDAKGNKAPK